jgi:phosphatidylglycerophosphate synthase
VKIQDSISHSSCFVFLYLWRKSFFIFFFYILLKRSFSDYIRAFFERSEEEGEPELSANDPQAQRRGSEGSH